MAKFEYLYTKSGVLSAPLLLYLIRHRMTEGKDFVKTWTAFLPKIFNPESPLLKFMQEDSRESEGI